MSQPISVDILSDDDDGDSQNDSNLPATVVKEPVYIDLSTPVPSNSKKKPRLLDSNNLNPSNAAVLIVDDDPTPQKHSLGSTSTVSMVEESPPLSSHYSKFGDALITDCSKRSSGMLCCLRFPFCSPYSKFNFISNLEFFFNFGISWNALMNRT